MHPFICSARNQPMQSYTYYRCGTFPEQSKSSVEWSTVTSFEKVFNHLKVNTLLCYINGGYTISEAVRVSHKESNTLSLSDDHCLLLIFNTIYSCQSSLAI